MFDTELAQSLKDLVEYSGYNRISKGLDASIGSIYNEIRKAGIEVDLQTVGYLYNDVLPKEFKQINSDEEVNEFVLKNYKDAIDRAAKLEDKEGEQQIGQDAPEQHVVNGILNMFTSTNTSDNMTKSDMLTMQNALWKGIQRKLNLPDNQQPKTKEQWKDILGKALGYQELGIRDLNGKLNSISDLYKAMQNELTQAKVDLRKQGNYAAADKFDEMTKALEASTYSLLFSKGEAKDLLNEMMKEAGFAKTLKNGNTILNWNKLAGDIGSVQDIRNNVQRVLEDNGYNADVIEGVKDSLQNEFEDLQAESIKRQLDNTEKMAAEITPEIIDNAINKILNGVPLNKWIENGNIETLQQLRVAAKKELVDAKYTNELKVAIVNRIADFFEKKYAKLNTVEAKRAVDNIVGDKGVLDWLKKNGINNKTELFAKLADSLSGRDLSDSQKQNIKNEFKRILDIENKAATDLKNRENATDREATKKTDLKRLAELNNLGIFQSSHDRLLHNLIGVSDLQQQDIADLKELAQAASDLYRHVDKNYGNDIYGSSALQTLQQKIDGIVARNINNKTAKLKALTVMRNTLEVYLTGLLIAPFTIVQNYYSGVKAVMSSLLFDKGGLSKEDANIWLNMVLNVTKTGQSFGEEIGSFAPRELYTNTLKFKWEGATLKEKTETALAVIMMPARVGLLALDSANKVLMTNKIFNAAMYKALTQKGETHEEALKTLNEALHGQSFEQAKIVANNILERINKTLSDKLKIPIDNSTITRLANDLIKANLNTNKLLSTTTDGQTVTPNDIIEAALKSSYHVAGIGLGHDPNNPVSRGTKLLGNFLAKNEQNDIKEKNWKKLARDRFINTFIKTYVIGFIGGATNWVWLRVQEGLGFGIVTGLIGNWKGDIDFKTKESVQQSIKDIQKSRVAIGRGITGLSITAMSYLIKYLLFDKDDDKDKKKRLAQLKELEKNQYLTKYQKENLTTQQKLDIQGKLKNEQKQLEEETNIYAAIKSNYEGSKLFKAVSPDIMLIDYYYHTDKDVLDAAFDYAINQGGLGNQYSVASKLQEARELNYKGDADAAKGQLASIVGDRLALPTWRGYKEWLRLGEWIGGADIKSNYKQPTEFMEGLLGGGTLEDLGFYNRDSKITNLPGIGGASYEKFKTKGIETMSDLKKHNNWWETKYQNEEGNTVYILDATARKKAKEAADKWFEQN